MLLAMTGVAVFAQTGSTGRPGVRARHGGRLRRGPAGPARRPARPAGGVHGPLPGLRGSRPASTPSSTSCSTRRSARRIGGAATWTGNIQTWSNGQFGLGCCPAAPGRRTAGAAAVRGHRASGVADRAALETPARRRMLGTGARSTTEDYAGSTITTAGDASLRHHRQLPAASAPRPTDVKTSLDVLAGTTPSLADRPRLPGRRGQHSQPTTSARSTSRRPRSSRSSSSGSAQQPGAEMLARPAGQPADLGQRLRPGRRATTLTLGGSAQLPSRGTGAVGPRDGPRGPLPGRHAAVPRDPRPGQHPRQLLAPGQAAARRRPQGQQTARRARAAARHAPWTSCSTSSRTAPSASASTASELSAGIVATLKDEASAERASRRCWACFGSSRRLDCPRRHHERGRERHHRDHHHLQGRRRACRRTCPSTPAVSVAVADGHLYLGLGDFAATALAQDPATSLATIPRYAAALTAAGTPNAGVVWVDVAAAAPLLSADGRRRQPVTTRPTSSPGSTPSTASWRRPRSTAISLSLKALLFVK